MTCDHCPRPAIARDCERLLCLDHYRARHETPEVADHAPRLMAHLDFLTRPMKELRRA